ncbi:MAG: response regulator [Phenylobacterium sp.]|uniref:response regulator n=1 Tax=Phenylobacterium sp. TaxID=1871053 RepID=UPI0027262A04|nr:response regulator [Phenylobacterium sp.]MDO8409618.1 response regulator [Phenylobacterium sp.]
MSLHPDIRMNLARSNVLLIDDNPQALEVLASIFRGFGVLRQVKCGSAAEAQNILRSREIDLIVCDTVMPDMDGYDFVRWLRREGPEEARFSPVIMLTGHAARSTVESSRDCGANFIVSKPFTPEVLLQRIYWVAKDERAMVRSDTYVGPDRRFRNIGPPLGVKGRRKDDLSTHVGMAKDPNMDQDEIDMLLKPQRAAL